MIKYIYLSLGVCLGVILQTVFITIDASESDCSNGNYLNTILNLDYIMQCIESRIDILEDNTDFPEFEKPIVPSTLDECISLGYDYVTEINAENNIETKYCMMPTTEIVKVNSTGTISLNQTDTK